MIWWVVGWSLGNCLLLFPSWVIVAGGVNDYRLDFDVYHPIRSGVVTLTLFRQAKVGAYME